MFLLSQVNHYVLKWCLTGYYRSLTLSVNWVSEVCSGFVFGQVEKALQVAEQAPDFGWHDLVANLAAVLL